MMMSKSVTVLALVLVGCGGASQAAKSPESPESGEHDEHHQKPSSSEAKKEVKAPGEAKPGDRSTCPVSGEEFDVTASSPHAEHDGKTYYFCCSGCKKKFESDPSKFTAPSPRGRS